MDNPEPATFVYRTRKEDLQKNTNSFGPNKKPGLNQGARKSIPVSYKTRAVLRLVKNY